MSIKLTLGQALHTALCLAVIGTGMASAQTERARFLYGEGGSASYLRIKPSFAVKGLPAGGTIPMWNSSFSVSGTTYSYIMVGTNPATGSRTSTIPTVIVPVKFVFSDGTTLDPTLPVFGSALSAVQATTQSPVFQAYPFSSGPTPVGTTQYVDAFQRGNFWSNVTTTSPDYHVLLGTPTIAPTQTITVPKLFGKTVAGPGSRIGEVSITYFQRWLNSAVTSVPGISPTNLPLFLTYNTFFTQGGGCCILGFHTALGSSTSPQTVSVAAYSDPGIFSVPIQDIHALSHEIGEWMDDPLINNATPGWSAGQSGSSCQKNLEVGDPVTGIAFEVTMNGTTYHPEDLVFLPWFARQSPSSSVNGWYTFLNSFTAPPPVCN